MDIKSEVKFLVAYAKCQEAAEVEGEDEAFAFHGRRIRQSLDAINRWADMANAALAYVEHQAAIVHDPGECDLEYAQQRAKLWDAYMTARAKAKGTNNGST